MNVTKVSALNFRSNYQSNDPENNPQAFRRLCDTDRLDVLYFMMQKINRAQKSFDQVLLQNQRRMSNDPNDPEINPIAFQRLCATDKLEVLYFILKDTIHSQKIFR